MDNTKHVEQANALREIARWLENHPEVPLLPEHIYVYVGTNSREALQAIIKAGRPTRKGGGKQTELLSLVVSFGALKLEYVAWKHAVCEKRVVGTRIIPERMIEATEAKLIPETTEEITEWVCGPLLAEKEV